MPSLIYTGYSSKKTAKKKPGWQKAQAEYEAWLKKHGVDPNAKRKKKTAAIVNPVVATTHIRETPKIPSLDTRVTGAVSWGTERKVYTGDKMLGIAAMHKSNLVPIFQEEAAKEVSTMRRG